MSDDTSFSVSNRRQIIYNLSILLKNKCLLSVRFGEGKAFFLTAILEIDEKNNSIVFDYGPKEALNQQLLKAPRIIFEADFAGIKASFKGSNVQQILYNGEPAFTMLIPESIFWMQRREYFRVKSPRSKGSYCQLNLQGQDPVNLLLYDISLTGFSVLNTSTKISDLLIPGTQLEKCKLVLSGAGEDIIAFKICSKLIINPDKIAALKIQKIGCLFTQITPVFESVVQRYINQLQRESIQKMHEQN
ncbi:flagellar brake protein [Candidatus Methylobacter oryzae]|uniref:Flagellar brake protein YcgR n=2 Tax=Candidatus Methylobacter oryzae TaxID=2497749 RepID=A0ABY3CH95_9GAMM|nr:flagellar brake protein [Candidatus Methylobacter oryzae]